MSEEEKVLLLKSSRKKSKEERQHERRQKREQNREKREYEKKRRRERHGKHRRDGLVQEHFIPVSTDLFENNSVFFSLFLQAFGFFKINEPFFDSIFGPFRIISNRAITFNDSVAGNHKRYRIIRNS